MSYKLRILSPNKTIEVKESEILTPYSLSELFESYFQDKNLIIPLNLLKGLHEVHEHSKFDVTIDDLIKKINYLSLASDHLFQKYFIENLEFWTY